MTAKSYFSPALFLVGNHIRLDSTGIKNNTRTKLSVSVASLQNSCSGDFTKKEELDYPETKRRVFKFLLIFVTQTTQP